MDEVVFVTHNKGKIASASKQLEGVNFKVFEYDLGTISHLISKLDVDVLANFAEAKIEVTGNENLVEGENIITVTVTMPSESEEEADTLEIILCDKLTGLEITLSYTVFNYIDAIAKNDWKLLDFLNVDLSSLKVDSKQIGLDI